MLLKSYSSLFLSFLFLGVVHAGAPQNTRPEVEFVLVENKQLNNEGIKGKEAITESAEGINSVTECLSDVKHIFQELRELVHKHRDQLDDEDAAAVREAESEVATVKPYIATYFSPGILEVIKNLIHQEQDAITTAVYRLTHNDIAQLLIRKHNELKGIKEQFPVRVIVEKKFTDDWCIPLHSMIQAGIPVQCNVPRYTHSKGFEIMHHKFLIFYRNRENRRLLVTGSFNFTGQAEQNNWENIIITDDQAAITRFQEEFARLSGAARLISLEECHSFKDNDITYARRMNNIP